MFSNAITQRIIGESAIDDINVFAESMPAPKKTSPSNIAIISSNEIAHKTKKDIANYEIRMLVSGSDVIAITKAWELFDFFIPERNSHPAWKFSTNFVVTYNNQEWYILAVYWIRKPHFLRNNGNIFIAQIILNFSATLV